MALKLTDTGANYILDVIFNPAGYSAPTGYTVKLFTDSGTLSDADSSSNRTWASGGGYADKNPTATVPCANDGSGIPTATWTAGSLVWTFTGALTGGVSIKGYAFFCDAVLVYEELLSTPFTPANNGDTLTIDLVFKLSNGTPLAGP